MMTSMKENLMASSDVRGRAVVAEDVVCPGIELRAIKVHKKGFGCRVVEERL